MRRFAMPSRGGRARWVVIGVLALVGVAGKVTYSGGQALAAQALNVVFENADTDIGAVWFDFNGDVIAKDVVLYLEEGPTLAAVSETGVESGDDGTLRFERMRVSTGQGWLFYLRNMLDRRMQYAMVDQLKVSFDGFDSQTGYEPTLGTLGPMGALTGSPFEAEGCMQHAYFVRDELAQMGLVPGATSLEFDLREANSRIETRIVLNTPGVGRVQFDRSETLAKETTLLQLPETATSTVSDRWDISDQGFVAARNTFCAKQDGIDEATFVQRHLASVQRLFETRGLVVDAATMAEYADFATKGGQLAFGGTYSSPLHSSERAGVWFNGSAALRLQAKLEHGSRTVAVQWHGTPPRDLASEDGVVYAAIVKENGGVAPAMAMPAVNTGATMAAPVQAATTQVATTQSPVAAPAPQQPQYASSLPTAPPPQIAPGGRINWEDLPRYEGRMLQVFTMHAPPRTAMLLSADGASAKVRAPMQGGHADFRISREAFVKATLIQ